MAGWWPSALMRRGSAVRLWCWLPRTWQQARWLCCLCAPSSPTACTAAGMTRTWVQTRSECFQRCKYCHCAGAEVQLPSTPLRVPWWHWRPTACSPHHRQAWCSSAFQQLLLPVNAKPGVPCCSALQWRPLQCWVAVWNPIQLNSAKELLTRELPGLGGWLLEVGYRVLWELSTGLVLDLHNLMHIGCN